jgi:hypothetical protein
VLASQGGILGRVHPPPMPYTVFVVHDGWAIGGNKERGGEQKNAVGWVSVHGALGSSGLFFICGGLQRLLSDRASTSPPQSRGFGKSNLLHW